VPKTHVLFELGLRVVHYCWWRITRFGIGLQTSLVTKQTSKHKATTNNRK